MIQAANNEKRRKGRSVGPNYWNSSRFFLIKYIHINIFAKICLRICLQSSFIFVGLYSGSIYLMQSVLQKFWAIFFLSSTILKAWSRLFKYFSIKLNSNYINRNDEKFETDYLFIFGFRKFDRPSLWIRFLTRFCWIDRISRYIDYSFRRKNQNLKENGHPVVV